jgi:predicted enzyme related to lactoylglutathione lyase
MAKVIGIGGLFFKSADPKVTREWYARVLGLSFEDWGGLVFRPETAAAHPGAGAVFCPFSGDTAYFQPSSHDFMFNLMVNDLEGMLARCRAEGVEPFNELPNEFNGCFAHIMDPDGRKIELWEPKPAE